MTTLSPAHRSLGAVRTWTIEVREADTEVNLEAFLDAYARVLLAEVAAQRRAEAAREESAVDSLC